MDMDMPLSCRRPDTVVRIGVEVLQLWSSVALRAVRWNSNITQKKNSQRSTNFRIYVGRPRKAVLRVVGTAHGLAAAAAIAIAAIVK